MMLLTRVNLLRGAKQMFLLLLLSSAGYGLWFWLTWHKGYESAAHLVYSEQASDLKTILLYTPLDGAYSAWRREFPSSLLQCRDDDDTEYTCRVTSNQDLLGVSSAVLVSIGDINSWTWTWMPLDYTPPDQQKWIALWGESPHFFFDNTWFKGPRYLSSLNGIFHWFASYRRDSDLQTSYNHLDKDYCTWQRTEHPLQLDEASVLSQKSDLALWIVSHCATNSHRERYVEELQKVVNVTVLGTCGQLGPDDNAFKSLEWHKFYLSFENSLCDDYITEKFFGILNHNTVPVVMGPKRADYELQAPPNSFIHISDFSGPKELGEYLIYLDNNPEEYMKYLEWKKHYVLSCRETWSCRLCRNLHNKTMMAEDRKISDFLTMWEKSECYENWNYTRLSTQ